MNKFKISMKAYLYTCKYFADRWGKKSTNFSWCERVKFSVFFPKRKWFILWFVVYRTTTVKLLLYISKIYLNIQHPTYTNITTIYNNKAYYKYITDDNSNTCCCCCRSIVLLICFFFSFHLRFLHGSNPIQKKLSNTLWDMVKWKFNACRRWD